MDSPDLLITGSNPVLVSREQLADWVHRLLDLEDLLVGAPTRRATHQIAAEITQILCSEDHNTL